MFIDQMSRSGPYFSLLLIFSVLYLNFFPLNSDVRLELNLFVSPVGSDTNLGTLTSPFLTILKAQNYIRFLRKRSAYKKITVYLRGGKYFIPSTLLFKPEDAGNDEFSIEYKAYRSEIPIIVGGIRLPAEWIKVDSLAGNYWKLKVNFLDTKGVFNQLFSNGQRLLRSSSPVFYTKGPLERYNTEVQQISGFNYSGSNRLMQKDLLPFCSFTYANKDLSEIHDANNVEILLYHSWDCSWHKVSKIDTNSKEVFLNTPSHFPVGFFNNKNKYVVENCRLYFNKDLQWYLDIKKQELWYKANANENPNLLEFIVPTSNTILNLEGDINTPVQNLNFIGIAFQYSKDLRGVNVDQNQLKKFSSAYTWLDSSSGFSGLQGSVECGQSVKLQYSKKCTFDKCTFSHLGNYGLRIDQYSSNNVISECEFADLGGGGIIIGINNSHPISAHIPFGASPVGNKVINCLIHDGGIIYPSALGIGIRQSRDNIIVHNNVYNFAYIGIGCGWTWGKEESYTSGNIIEFNHVHHVMRSLADGGGIYTIGIQPNTIIKGNLIHDIYRSKDATGSMNNGIFLDEGSSGIFLDSNIIYHIQNQPIRLHAVDSTKINWGRHNFLNINSEEKIFRLLNKHKAGIKKNL